MIIRSAQIIVVLSSQIIVAQSSHIIVAESSHIIDTQSSIILTFYAILMSGEMNGLFTWKASTFMCPLPNIMKCRFSVRQPFAVKLLYTLVLYGQEKDEIL